MKFKRFFYRILSIICFIWCIGFFFSGIVLVFSKDPHNSGSTFGAVVSFIFAILLGLLAKKFFSLLKEKEALNTSVVYQLNDACSIASETSKEKSLSMSPIEDSELEMGYQVEYLHHDSDDYLNQILPNGKTIREQREDDLKEALSKSDPGQHSDQEEELIYHFSQNFQQTISLAESKLYTLANNAYIPGSNIDEQIIKLKKVIAHFEQYRDFCYSKGIGGKLYFQDMWEHCHNSSNPDFNYITQIQERLEYLELRKNGLDNMAEVRKKILELIRSNPGILQKNLYKHFSPELKLSIRGEMMELESEGIISRTKSGNSYELYIINSL